MRTRVNENNCIAASDAPDRRAGRELPNARAGAAWFCVRTQPRREHIAAAQLRHDPDIEVLLPQIRYKRATRLGPLWTTEALFQNYLFASFDFEKCLRRVHHGRAVRGV